MIYSMISYFPIYVLATIVLRFYSHFSLVSFYAYTTFLFSLYHFPAIDIFLVISDKFLITLTFLLAVAVQLPYSLITALCSGLGIWIWRKDFLGLSYFARETVDPNDGQPLNLVQSRIAGTSGETVDMFDSSLPGSIRSIVEMGFSEFQALTALRANNNDVQRAVEHLLIH
jgi:hypothetical protein